MEAGDGGTKGVMESMIEVWRETDRVMAQRKV